MIQVADPVDLDLSLRLLRPGAIGEAQQVDHDLAFDLWHQVWLETRREIDDALPAYSDSFSRQDEILVLRHGERPIATCCHRYVDLRRRSTMLDSYFSPDVWPEPVRAMIPLLGDSCALGGHVFVHPDFRGGRSRVPIRALMCTLSLLRMEHAAPDLLLGAVRTDRGMDRVFRDHGSVTLGRASWRHLPVDLIAIFPRKFPVVADPRCAATARAVIGSCENFRDRMRPK